jgi:hypothetical protein
MVEVGDEPFDRLTKLCAEMAQVLEREDHGIKGILFLNDGQRGGIELFNYSDQTEAMADLFVHMQAVFRSAGKDLEFIGIPETPEGL